MDCRDASEPTGRGLWSVRPIHERAWGTSLCRVGSHRSSNIQGVPSGEGALVLRSKRILMLVREGKALAFVEGHNEDTWFGWFNYWGLRQGF